MFSNKHWHHFLNLSTLLAFGFVCVKSCKMAITHDEAYSFYIVKNFWYAEAFCTGNTHWLNSAAIKMACLLNFEQVPSIRFFSIFSAAVFIWLLLGFIRSLNTKSMAIFAFAFMALNLYVLDYFCVARGYASGIMLEAISLYFLHKFEKNKKSAIGFYALVFSGLSCLSNYSFNYFFLAFSLLYFYRIYFNSATKFFKNPAFYRDAFTTFIIGGFLIRAMLFLKACSNDFVGAGTDLYSEFLSIVPIGFIYGKMFFSASLSGFFSVFILLLLFCMAAYGSFFHKCHQNKFFQLTAILLFLILVIILISHVFFHMVLPANRSALFLFPLTSICFIYTLQSILPPRPLSHWSIILAAALLILNFVLSANIRSNFDFQFNANVEDCFDDLNRLNAKQVGLCSGFYGAYHNYYTQLKKNPLHFNAQLIKADDNAALPYAMHQLNDADYLLLLPPYDLKYYQGNSVKLFPLKYYAESKAFLFGIKSK